MALGNVQVALLKFAPDVKQGSPDIPGGEADYTGYGRAACNAWGPAAPNGLAENKAEMRFGECTASGHSVSHFAVMDGDRCLSWGPITPPRTLAVGETPSFRVGELVVTET